MKNNTIPQTFRLRRKFYLISPFAFIGAILLTLSFSTLSAQSIDASASELTATGDIVTKWKTPTEYATIITALSVDNEQLLADPNLHSPELALYTGYGRLLNYMRVDLVANVPLDDIADKNFKKVITESLTDPALNGMSVESFTAMYNELVERLHP